MLVSGLVTVLFRGIYRRTPNKAEIFSLDPGDSTIISKLLIDNNKSTKHQIFPYLLRGINRNFFSFLENLM